jgi:Transposase DDE domain group 1
MSSQFTTREFLFQPRPNCSVCVRFDGGTISSDGGCLLLAEVEQRLHLLQRLADCFSDHRDAELIEHSVAELVGQRVYGIALGYEDLNDHDYLRLDPLLATLVGKSDRTGQSRLRPQDRGKALAGKSTLNRLELTPPEATAAHRYKKIVARPEQIDRLLLDVFLEAHATPPEQIVLDLDATDDPLHGHQEGRFFHGYYREYCYLPLYIFCGEHLLCARLRTADHGEAAGALAELVRLITAIRSVWPQVRILLRGDSAFAREEIMAWCEANAVDYLFGLAKNSRLVEMIGAELAMAQARYLSTAVASRVYAELRYRTLDSWSRERRVVGKAEWMEKGANPRFVVTSLTLVARPTKPVYEEDYCARGEMENRIKEQKQGVASDRTSTGQLRSNQLRLYWASMAYVLLSGLRRLGLAGTALARAQCWTLRNCLLKIGAMVKVATQGLRVSLSSAWPWQEVFAQAYARLQQLPVWRAVPAASNGS